MRGWFVAHAAVALIVAMGWGLPGEASDAVPPGLPPAITLSLGNATGFVRYTDFGRSPFDHVTLERFEGGQWSAVAYREPYCSVPCAPGGRQPDCTPCSPPMPRPSWLKPHESVTHRWQGQSYSTQMVGEQCPCHRQSPAPHGRYRARVCVYPTASCGAAPCTERGADAPSLTGDPVCAESEFVHDGQDRTVEITIAR